MSNTVLPVQSTRSAAPRLPHRPNEERRFPAASTAGTATVDFVGEIANAGVLEDVKYSTI